LDYPTFYAAVIVTDGIEKIAGYNPEDMQGTIYTYLYPEYVKIPTVVRNGEIDYDKIVEIGIDAYIVLSEYDADEYEELAAKGLTPSVESGDGEGKATANNRIFALMQATGNITRSKDRIITETSNIYIDFDAMIDSEEVELKETERKSVLFLGDTARSVYTHTAADEIIEHSHGINAAKDLEIKSDIICQSGRPLKEFTEVTAEKIVQWNPDVIWIPYYSTYGVDDVMNDPELSQVTAVKNGDVYIFPGELEPWYDSTLSMYLGTCWAANNLYPELYPYERFMEKVDEFYTLCYGRTFTEKELGLTR
jgi:iron complex transport system substrate-binding protein